MSSHTFGQMPWFYRLFSIYLNSSLHVGLAAACLLVTTQIRYGVDISFSLTVFVFSSTVLSYNLVKYAEFNGLQWKKVTPIVGVISLIAVWCVATLTQWLYWEQIWLLLLGAGLTVFYALPLFGWRSLRAMPVIKPIIVAVVWTIATYLVPLQRFWEWDMIIGLVGRMLFIFALTMPFEIRDLNFDDSKLGTIPQLYGVVGTKWIGSACILIAGLFELWIPTGTVWIILFIYLLTLVMLWMTTRQRNQWFVTFWVEAIPVVWLGTELLTYVF